MKKNFTNEFKIGLFIVLAVCVGVIFWSKTHTTTIKTYEVKTAFKYAGGLKVNSLVWLCGIEVGRVTKIDFQYEPETLVNLTLTLYDYAKVRKDSIAYISTAGFIGDSYVGISAGTPGTAFAAPGESIGSEDPIEMRELMKKADAIATKLNDTLTDVKALAGTLNSKVTSTLGKVDDTLTNFKKLGENLNGIVEDNRPKINNIVSNVESMTGNFDEFSSDVKQHPWKLLMKGKE